VTGRHLRDGTTNLLIDLKRRQLLNEEKLNYELNIGARKFKCTTIPIKRKEFGIVGAFASTSTLIISLNRCCKIDNESKRGSETSFVPTCSSTKNILSKDEYAKALKGKRHFRDETV
jgi:hypothetical protein